MTTGQPRPYRARVLVEENKRTRDPYRYVVQVQEPLGELEGVARFTRQGDALAEGERQRARVAALFDCPVDYWTNTQ